LVQLDFRSVSNEALGNEELHYIEQAVRSGCDPGPRRLLAWEGRGCRRDAPWRLPAATLTSLCACAARAWG